MDRVRLRRATHPGVYTARDHHCRAQPERGHCRQSHYFTLYSDNVDNYCVLLCAYRSRHEVWKHLKVFK